MLFAMMMIAITTQAQISLGVKSNLVFNDTKINSGSIDLNNTIKSMQGYSIGATATYRLSPHWALSSELLYKHIGFQLKESTSFGVLGLDIPIGATIETSVNYLELPILLKYIHEVEALQVYVEAGPSIHYALDGRVESVANSILDFNLYSTDLNLSGDSFNRINASANIGAGLMYPFNHDLTLTAGIRYTKDLSNSVNLPIVDSTIRNSSFGIGLGVEKKF